MTYRNDKRPAAIGDVSEFWNTEACGTHFIRDAANDAEFFTRFRDFRYTTEWHIKTFADFPRWRGKSVLEIGTGNGAEAAMFTCHGARYAGIDLTRAAVDATRRHLQSMGLGGQLVVGSAETLPFANSTFDLVYSYGVLHHTPHQHAAIAECTRVLRPGGELRLMLYHKMSFNYYFRIMTYMRCRVLAEIVLASLSAARRPVIRGIRGNDRREVWRAHYNNFRRFGWAYLRSSEFINHATDGPDCPIASVYTKDQIRSLLCDNHYSSIELSVAHFPIGKAKWGRLLPFRLLESSLARSLGWHLLIRATK